MNWSKKLLKIAELLKHANRINLNEGTLEDLVGEIRQDSRLENFKTKLEGEAGVNLDSPEGYSGTIKGTVLALAKVLNNFMNYLMDELGKQGTPTGNIGPTLEGMIGNESSEYLKLIESQLSVQPNQNNIISSVINRNIRRIAEEKNKDPELLTGKFGEEGYYEPITQKLISTMQDKINSIIENFNPTDNLRPLYTDIQESLQKDIEDYIDQVETPEE